MWHLLLASLSCQTLQRAVKAAASGSPEPLEQVQRRWITDDQHAQELLLLPQ